MLLKRKAYCGFALTSNVVSIVKDLMDLSMVNLQIDFPVGAYSSNKEDIKKVFALLDYKYKSGIPNGERLICTWKREADKKTIKGIFNGSGMACQFIIECESNEEPIFKSFETSFNARVSIHTPNTTDTSIIMGKAIANVLKWFVIVPPYKGEPEQFYKYRRAKMEVSKQWFIEQEYNRLLNAN